MNPLKFQIYQTGNFLEEEREIINKSLNKMEDLQDLKDLLINFNGPIILFYNETDDTIEIDSI